MSTRILIAGIGGVGGYFGGLLARAYADDPALSVHFLARGAHLDHIHAHGLTVQKGDTIFTARPQQASDSGTALGQMDYILICTKSFGLAEVLQEIRPCVGPETVIVPLLNGVDSREQIVATFPESLVTEGCAYIISRLTGPGRIENTGQTESLFFGLDGCADPRLQRLEQFLKGAGITACCPDTISSVIWEKFVFLSPLATATAFFDLTTGALRDDTAAMNTLRTLVQEALALAFHRGIALREDIAEATLRKIAALPPAATTSLHSDFRAGKNTELETLTGFVVREAAKEGLDVPVFDRLYRVLKTRNPAVT